MNSTTRTLSAAAFAVAAMYCFDPTSGRHRRARLRDKVQQAARRIERGLDAGAQDLAHRLIGIAAEVRAAFDHGPVDGVVVAERVRSALGRVVAHPGAIDVRVEAGRVELKGEILAEEYPRLMRAVWAVHGVQGVNDRLGVYESARGVSSLQGGRHRDARQLELLQENWSPGARLLVNTTGLLLAAYGLRRGSVQGLLSAAVGGALLARGATNMPLSKFAGARTTAVKVQKTLRVNVPVERVFDVLAHYENFPYFMHNVRSVRMHPDGHSHWRVVGPMGATVEWDAETVASKPHELLAWRTLPNAHIRHSGTIHFHGENGRTCLNIELCYNPPAGMLGHGVAKLLGVDPKTELDEDLLRLKTFLETGKPAHDCALRDYTAVPARRLLQPAPPEAPGAAAF